jgi:hypothetical protein
MHDAPGDLRALVRQQTSVKSSFGVSYNGHSSHVENEVKKEEDFGDLLGSNRVSSCKGVPAGVQPSRPASAKYVSSEANLASLNV